MITRRLATEVGAGALLQRSKLGEVVGTKPVVGVQKGDGVESLGHRPRGAMGPGRVAVVAVGLGQAQVLHAPAVQRVLGVAIGHQDVRDVGVGLLAHAVHRPPQPGQGLLVVGRDDGDAHGGQ